MCEKFILGFRGLSAIVWGEKDPILGRVLRRVMEIMPDAPVTRTKAGHFIEEGRGRCNSPGNNRGV